MGSITLVTGGARSGKSTFAEQLASGREGTVLYIATSVATDEEMRSRIQAHQQARPKTWQTVEMYRGFELLLGNDDFHQAGTLLLDCVTIMVSNLLLESKLDFERCSMAELGPVEDMVRGEVGALVELVRNQHKDLILVTNELGMGLVPPYRLGRIFRDVAGRVNQYLAQAADEVYLIVSGLPVKLKWGQQ
ncbi:MAG: bifunctional adenosylcobinamide kinase/adenosylcobinamide-phosphate guanylyltransferase [Limnochordia bacterium]